MKSGKYFSVPFPLPAINCQRHLTPLYTARGAAIIRLIMQSKCAGVRTPDSPVLIIFGDISLSSPRLVNALTALDSSSPGLEILRLPVAAYALPLLICRQFVTRGHICFSLRFYDVCRIYASHANFLLSIVPHYR